MRKQKVYLETTVFNYYFDKFKNANSATVAFFEAIGAGQFEGYTSVYTYNELKEASEPLRTNMMKLIDKYHITVLETSSEIVQLADKYLLNNIIPEKKESMLFT